LQSLPRLLTSSAREGRDTEDGCLAALGGGVGGATEDSALVDGSGRGEGREGNEGEVGELHFEGVGWLVGRLVECCWWIDWKAVS